MLVRGCALNIRELKERAEADAIEAANKLRVARYMKNESAVKEWETYIERQEWWLAKIAEFED